MRVWIVVAAYKGCIDQTEIFSSYNEAFNFVDRLKRTVYKDVHDQVQMEIHKREVNKIEGLW